MKKLTLAAGILSGALALMTFSCSSLEGLLKPPSASIKSVAPSGLDFEGITFNCNYAITNPYGVSLSVKDISVDVDCNNSKVTSISTNNGISVRANTTSNNSASFKVPYESIVNLAKNISSATKKLPFGIDGSITLDTSSIPALAAIGTNSISIPLSADFDVPVFKPKMSVSNFKVKMPSFTDLKDQLINGGLGVTKAIEIATTLLSGNKLTPSIFNGIDMDIDFTFDLNVANEGASSWNFNIADCSLNTEYGSIADVVPVTNKTISSDGKIQMKASLNTLQSGAFIVQLLNKTGKNPTFNLVSNLSFPDTSYAKNIPLKYSAEIPLANVSK